MQGKVTLAQPQETKEEVVLNSYTALSPPRATHYTPHDLGKEGHTCTLCTDTCTLAGHCGDAARIANNNVNSITLYVYFTVW